MAMGEGNRSVAPSRALPDVQQLNDLLSRVEAATGPDRELDAAICEALFGVTVDRKGNPAGWGVWAVVSHADPEGGDISAEAFDRLSFYTASIDAALVLVKRVLPEHGPISLIIAGSAECMIDANDACAPALGKAFGKTPPLAILAALLKAIQAQASESPARDGASPQTTTAKWNPNG
jgi:hypothetical protein